MYTLQALAFGALDKPADAARALRMAIAINPDNPAALYTLAQQLTRLEQPAEATRALRDCQRALAKREATSKGTPPDAAPFERIDLLRQVAGVAPIFPQARYTDGYAALRTGDYATAVTRIAEAAAGDPIAAGEPAAREPVARAAALVRTGQLETALQQLQGVIAEAPEKAEGHRLLGLDDVGSVAVGRRADLVLLGADLRVVHTVVGGRVVFESSEVPSWSSTPRPRWSPERSRRRGAASCSPAHVAPASARADAAP